MGMGMVSKDILRNGDWRLCSMSPDGPDEAIRAAGNCHCVKGSEDPIPHTIRRQWPRGRPGAGAGLDQLSSNTTR